MTKPKRLFEIEVVETVLKKVIVLAHSEEDAVRVSKERAAYLSQCASRCNIRHTVGHAVDVTNAPFAVLAAYDIARDEWVNPEEE